MNNIKMLKVLQLTVIILGVVLIIIGLFVFFFLDKKLENYGKFINYTFPIWSTLIGSALIGKPLTEGVRNLTNKEGK